MGMKEVAEETFRKQTCSPYTHLNNWDVEIIVPIADVTNQCRFYEHAYWMYRFEELELCYRCHIML